MVAVGAAKIHSKLRREGGWPAVVGGPDDESIELLSVRIDRNYEAVVGLVGLLEVLVEAVRRAIALGSAWVGSPEELDVLGLLESASVPADSNL